MSLRRSLSLVCLSQAILFAFAAVVGVPSIAHAATIFESGSLGPTGISSEDVLSQVVLGVNVRPGIFSGVRFQISEPVITTEVGGHFVGPFFSDDTFFGAIVRLDDENDFPDSDDLSTPDVLGDALLTFPEPSDDVFGDLNLFLEPGWYALMFGSGLFGTTGAGAALRNNTDTEMPDYIGFMSGFGWGHRAGLDNKRFVVKGHIVPEPPSSLLAWLAWALLACRQSSVRW